jgi:NDP-sugar pyrophosphorylase family protein
MTKPIRVGVLGAGLGSRLASRAKAKPLALLGSKSLLSHLISALKNCGIVNIQCALRDELLTPEEKNGLPREDGVSFLFVNTESSLHTLVELIGSMGTQDGPALFTMADTVLRPQDLLAFVDFCQNLPAGECAVLTTTFVDDEKPLWVHVKPNGEAAKFSSEPALQVTSGMYFLQPQAMEIAKELTGKGVHKMRNFLAELTTRGMPIKTFVVSKTIDVDHPSDLDKAAAFIQGD